MNNKIVTKKDEDFFMEAIICQCNCFSSDHKLIFEKIFWDNGEEETDKEISVFIGMSASTPFRYRLREMIKFLFGRSNKYTSHDILFDKTNVDQLESAIRWIKENN